MANIGLVQDFRLPEPTTKVTKPAENPAKGSAKIALGYVSFEQNVRLANHTYIAASSFILTDILGQVARQGPGYGAEKVNHVHIYCHELLGDVNDDGVFRLKLDDKTASTDLKSLSIFSAHIGTFKQLVIDSLPSDLEIRFFYDIESGPDSFWINQGMPEHESIHVLRSLQSCLTSEYNPCQASNHIDMSGMIGLRFKVGQPSSTSSSAHVTAIEAIKSVPPGELLPLRVVDFELLGPDVRLLQNLPRLLDSLFSSACGELMSKEPKISWVLGALRFVKSCAGGDSNYVEFISEIDSLLARLRLPRQSSTWQTSNIYLQYEAQKRESIEPRDWYYVPVNAPKVLIDALQPVITNLLSEAKSQDTDEQLKTLADTLGESLAIVLSAVKLTIGANITERGLESARSDAAYATDMARNKMDELMGFKTSMEDAKRAFDKGLKSYEQRKKEEAKMAVLKGIGTLIFNVGTAVYSGGAGAPATIGTIKELISGAKSLTEKGRLRVLVESLAKAAVEVVPKTMAVFKDQARFDKDVRKSSLDKLRDAGSGMTNELLSSQIGDKVDHNGLLASWREMDVSATLAFDCIRQDIAPDKIDGLEQYILALRKLVLHGEALIATLREASEARSKYLLSEAARMAKEKAENEIDLMNKAAKTDKAKKDIATLFLLHNIHRENAQRRRIIFNRMLEVILALIYRTNDLKFQKSSFASLSPQLSISALGQQWEKLSKAAIPSEQYSNIPLSMPSSAIFGPDWRILLISEQALDFCIPTTLPDLRNKHRMRINNLHFEFIGLKKVDDTGGNLKEALKEVPYLVTIGPTLLDRVRQNVGGRQGDATIVQYYMHEQTIEKRGSRGSLSNQDDFAKRALCATGRLSFPAAFHEAKWNLASISDIILRVDCEYSLLN